MPSAAGELEIGEAHVGVERVSWERASASVPPTVRRGRTLREQF